MFKNKIQLKILSISENEALARNVIACFLLQLNPSISQLSDVKTAVSEAVTNSIVHGYENTIGEIEIDAEIIDKEIHIKISDNGIGIKDLKSALEPFYTTKPEQERSGMGFTIMQSFMDEIKVESNDNGTCVYMCKSLNDCPKGA